MDDELEYGATSEQEEAEEKYRREMELENRFDDWKEGERYGI